MNKLLISRKVGISLFVFALGAGAACAATAVPLPEHPRPDWERAEWMNLNGEWDFGFAAGAYDRKIVVPFGWGSKLSGVKSEGDTGHYRREVTVPAAWKGKRVFVVVGASDHDTTCTFDGEQIGSYSGGYVPFEFELTDFVRWGEAQKLEFTVWDPADGVARDGHYLYGKQGYGNCRGIWQTVYLEARGDTYLEETRLKPHLASSSVTATVRLSAPAKKNASAALELDGRTTSVPFAVGEREKSVEIALAQPKLWDLDHPHLYDVTVSYGNDRVNTYFGFREIGTGKNPNGDAYLTLNGKPIYLQLCLDQSYHPEGFYTFPTDEFMKNEILIAKRLGLSGNRVHIKVEVPRKLYWADKLGLLIQADVPCAWGDTTERMFEEHWKCFEAMVKRDFNHPSVYQWTLFNETWGLKSNPSLKMGLAAGRQGKKTTYRPWSQRRVAEAYFKAKKIDPTRIVEDNSPCRRDHVVTDVNSWHAYTAGWNWEKCVAGWCDNTYPGSTANFIGGHCQNGEPMMNSECGNVWGYRGSTGDCDFSWDYHLMMNAFRRHLKCCGWLYTEHHDVINEWNGYVRFDRSAKDYGFTGIGMDIRDLHGKASLYFAGPLGAETAETKAPGSRVTLPVGVSFVTDEFAGRKLSLERRIWFYDAAGERREAGAPVAEAKTAVAKSWQCETIWQSAFDLPNEPAAGGVVYALKADGAEIAHNVWCFSTVAADAVLPSPVAATWSAGATNVLSGLKLNGFGKGFFEFDLPAPAKGGLFVAELSSKRKNGKDYGETDFSNAIDRMLGGGEMDRGKNPNSYPMTAPGDCHPANAKVYFNGRLAWTGVLPNDPADHRGILSWLAQPSRSNHLFEAGSYGYAVRVPVKGDDVKGGRVRVRLESDAGLAVYGPRFGRIPTGPCVRPSNQPTVRFARPNDVRIADGFWAPRLELWRTNTIGDVLTKLETKSHIAENFRLAASGAKSGHRGQYFFDGLYCEAVCGASDYLARCPDAALERRLDGIVDRIVAAQRADGYLNTRVQVEGEERRWGDNGACGLDQHEIYDAGCLLEAGIHHYRATGKAKLLAAGIRFANLLVSTIGPAPKRNLIPGHSLAEDAFVQLADLLAEDPAAAARAGFPGLTAKPYLDLVGYWLDNHGNNCGLPDWEKLGTRGAIDWCRTETKKPHAPTWRPSYGDYQMDKKPLADYAAIEGHAVRATLLCAGIAAYARVRSSAFHAALATRFWESMVGRKMYISGGVGADAGLERFVEDYRLPCDAYLETCAAVGSAFFSLRMAELTGDGRHFDEVERVAYNALLTAVGADGKSYAYRNPLNTQKGSRWDWHGCPCCPPMFLKLTGRLPTVACARDAEGIRVNLFMDGAFSLGDVRLVLDTRYPDEGAVTIRVRPATPRTFALRVRVPGWARGCENPFGLYASDKKSGWGLSVNGERVTAVVRSGYAVLTRAWKDGDEVTLTLDVGERTIRADARVGDVRDKVARMRGPVLMAHENGKWIPYYAVANSGPAPHEVWIRGL